MLYTADCLRPGHAATCFERNQLSPGSINLSLLDAGHTSDLHISTAIGPPRRFPHASACPRLDRPVPGLVQVTSGTFSTPCHAGKPATHLSLSLRLPTFVVNLATQTNSLARSSKRMIRRCNTVLVLPPRDGFLRTAGPFTPYPTITNWFQALFTALLGVLFSFRSPYYCAIGLKTYLALEVGVSQLPV